MQEKKERRRKNFLRGQDRGDYVDVMQLQMTPPLRHHLLVYISHHTTIVATSSHSDLCKANDTVYTVDLLLFCDRIHTTWKRGV